MHSRFAAIMAMALFFLSAVAAVHAQTLSPGPSLIDKVAPSIVTIQVVIKIQVKAGGQSQSSESKLTTEGVAVTPDGLIMMSNAPISSDVLKQMLGGGDEDRASVNIAPTEFKITIGNEEKEYSGFLAATDAKLGLAFVKIEDLGDRKLTAVDFSHSASVAVGDQLAAITRMGKGYDYAPVFSQGPVKGAITKPRTAYLLSTSIVSIGLPVYTLSGDTVGVLVFLPAGVDTDSGSMDMMMRYYSGAAADRLGIFLIAGSTVQPIITEAIAQAAKLASDRAKNPPAKPAAPSKPAGTAPKTTAPTGK
jgi:hypothetical protein